MKYLKTFNESSEDKDVKRKIKEKEREIEKLKNQYKDIDKSKVSAHKSFFKSKLSKLEQELKELKKTNEGFNLFGYKFGDDFQKSPAGLYAMSLLNIPDEKKKEAIGLIEDHWAMVIKNREGFYKGYSKSLFSDDRPSGLSQEGEDLMIEVVSKAKGEVSVDKEARRLAKKLSGSDNIGRSGGHGQPGMRHESW